MRIANKNYLKYKQKMDSCHNIIVTKRDVTINIGIQMSNEHNTEKLVRGQMTYEQSLRITKEIYGNNLHPSDLNSIAYTLLDVDKRLCKKLPLNISVGG